MGDLNVHIKQPTTLTLPSQTVYENRRDESRPHEPIWGTVTSLASHTTLASHANMAGDEKGNDVEGNGNAAGNGNGEGMGKRSMRQCPVISCTVR
jgi:hypothetical protein